MITSEDLESARRRLASQFDGIQISSTLPFDVAKLVADTLNVESLRSQFASQFDGTQQPSTITYDINGETIAMLFIEQLKSQIASQSHDRSEQYYKIPDHIKDKMIGIEDKMIARRYRSARESDARCLRRPLTYGYNSALKQRYTCIWSGGTHSWTEALSGIIWVAVHGTDSICAVTRIKDLEHEITLRVAMLKTKPEHLLHIFTLGLIGKIEGFVDPSTLPRRLLHRIIKKPFGVVSVIPDTKIVRKTSSAKYDKKNAIKFLQNEMESKAAFTYDKTVQTAISALDHLFHQRFKANEIMVFVWKKDGGGQAKALPHIREELDIEEHLAVINKPEDSCLF